MKFVLAIAWSLLCLWSGFYFVKDIHLFNAWWALPYMHTVLGVGGIGVYLIMTSKEMKP